MKFKFEESPVLMHPRIAGLALRLETFMANEPIKPTSDDRKTLTNLRNEIKQLGDGDGIVLSATDVRDRQFLYVKSTQAANRQEDFFEKNGNKWSDEQE